MTRKIQSTVFVSTPRMRIPGTISAAPVTGAVPGLQIPGKVATPLLNNGQINPLFVPTALRPGQNLQIASTAMTPVAGGGSPSLGGGGGGSPSMGSPSGGGGGAPSSPSGGGGFGGGGSGYSPSRRADDGDGWINLASLPPPRTENLSPETQNAFETLKKLANNHSACGNYRPEGKGPINSVPGFFYGTAFSFARSACRSDSDPVKQTMGQSRQTMLNNYSRLFSLGMYESDGGRDIGRDKSNSSSGTGDTAEAGIWQSSNNVRNLLPREAQASLAKLERDYSQNPDACMAGVFGQGLGRVKDGPIYGGGAGARFQILLKRCPALAAEHAQITTLYNERHYGPLIRSSQRAKPVPACTYMLRDIEKVVQEHRETMCPALAVNPVLPSPNPAVIATARK